MTATTMTSTSPSLSHEDARRAIDAHFAGRADPKVEAAMRAHTLDCASCRGHYNRHLLLARLDPSAPKAEARIGRGLGLRNSHARSPGRRAAWLAAFAVPAAAAMILLSRADHLRPGHRDVTKDPGAFVARSAGSGVRDPALWIYRVDRDGRTRLVSDSIQATDELAFAYANPAGKAYLLVFGVDEHRHVYWFHPAWAPGQAPPVAVAAVPGPGPHELGEAIRHGLDGRQLLIRALFADRPLGVADIEAEIQNAPSWDAPPALSPPEPSPMVGRMLRVLR
jgi:hypothetical protein